MNKNVINPVKESIDHWTDILRILSINKGMGLIYANHSVYTPDIEEPLFCFGGQACSMCKHYVCTGGELDYFRRMFNVRDEKVCPYVRHYGKQCYSRGMHWRNFVMFLKAYLRPRGSDPFYYPIYQFSEGMIDIDGVIFMAERMRQALIQIPVKLYSNEIPDVPRIKIKGLRASLQNKKSDWEGSF